MAQKLYWLDFHIFIIMEIQKLQRLFLKNA